MKYVALLRGINVGGNNLIKMSELKDAFEKHGLKNVKTYINSGNVIFEADENNKTLTKELENMLSKTFNYKARVMVKSQKQIQQVIKNVPSEWNTKDNLRCYIGFLADSLTAEESAKEVKIKEGVDSLKAGPGVLYMTTLLSERTKSAFSRLVGTSLYHDMTIRSYNTTKKILLVMEQTETSSSK